MKPGFQWSCRESNPGPDWKGWRFLHVYCFLVVGKEKEKQIPGSILSLLLNDPLAEMAHHYPDIFDLPNSVAARTRLQRKESLLNL